MAKVLDSATSFVLQTRESIEIDQSENDDFKLDLKSMDPRPGLVGLRNLGNTCFMNSALQCLSNTAPLTLFFVMDRWKSDLNQDNPLGMHGDIATVYSQLIGRMWNPLAHRSRALDTCVSPLQFKTTIGAFNSIFEGYGQHDSQELLGSLLDGLHEDLNRIVKKPYVELPEANDKTDSECASLYWDAYKKRNDSIIVDLFQGQFKSVVECLTCGFKSKTFDPFMFVSLPVPDRRMLSLSMSVFLPSVGEQPPKRVDWTVAVKRSATAERIYELACDKFNISSSECTILLIEVFRGAYFKVYTPEKSLFSAKESDTFVLAVIPKTSIFVPVYFAKGEASDSMFDANGCSLEFFGLSSLLCLSETVEYSMAAYLREASDEQNAKFTSYFVQKQLGSLIKERIDSLLQSCYGIDESIKYTVRLRVPKAPAYGYRSADSSAEKRLFWLTQGFSSSYEELVVYDPDLDSDSVEAQLDEFRESLGLSPRDVTPQRYELISSESNVLLIIDIDAAVLDALPASRLKDGLSSVPRDSSAGKTPAKPLTIYDCLGEFTKQEELGLNDTWYCPRCKDHRRVNKKMDIYRVPDVLVFHLKRFSSRDEYSRYSMLSAGKVDCLVHAPQSGLDLKDTVLSTDSRENAVYDLFAVSNHFGSMEFGHYTANARNPITGKWYNFDDSSVSEISEASVVTDAAYMLFYVRRSKHWFDEFERKYTDAILQQQVDIVRPKRSLSANTVTYNSEIRLTASSISKTFASFETDDASSLSNETLESKKRHIYSSGENSTKSAD